ncbi:MAG: hypothetical protein BIFFINMI_01691 [Phycisphaerae bacterium]|nr:hypothetical protein [Phycisphaerae bacterium]
MTRPASEIVTAMLGVAPPADAAGCRSRQLADNLAALRRADAELADAIAGLPRDACLMLEPSRSGPPTARAAGPDGVARYLHSRYDPLAEAAAQADAEVRPADLCYVLFGMGLGYLAAALLDRLPAEASVVVVERDRPTLAAALSLHDWSGPLAAGRLTLLWASDTAHLHRRLRGHNANILAGVRLVNSPTADPLDGPFMADVRRGLSDYVSFTRMGVVTLLLNNEATCRNLCHNAGAWLATPGIDALAGAFAGCPAVVVSAGPSLAAELPRLKTLADRVVIIAVQTTLRVLLEAGIRPHFVTSLDYAEISSRFFQDLPADELARVHLVAEPKANAAVLDTFTLAAAQPGRPAMISLLGNDLLDALLGPGAPPHARLPSGATVAHLAFYLAQHIGCDPIVFVGQDLGFSNGSYYTPGTAIHRLWSPELNRFNSLESMEWQRIVRDRPRLRRLADVHGRPIYLDEQMFTYLQQFQRDFAAAPQRVIDATGGGVRKEGAKVLSLAEVAAQLPDRPLPPEALAYRDRTDWFDASRIAPGLARQRERLDEVRSLRDICRRTLELLGTMDGLLTADPTAFNRAVAELDKLKAGVKEHGRVYAVVSFVSQSAELHRHRADRSLRIQGAQGVERRRFQLARDQAYVAAIADGCDRLEKILTESIARLERAAADGPRESV